MNVEKSLRLREPFPLAPKKVLFRPWLLSSLRTTQPLFSGEKGLQHCQPSGAVILQRQPNLHLHPL